MYFENPRERRDDFTERQKLRMKKRKRKKISQILNKMLIQPSKDKNSF